MISNHLYLILLGSAFSFSCIYASDAPTTSSYPLTDNDKALFCISIGNTQKYCSPYSSTLVESAPETFVSIEAKIFQTLLRHAINRSWNKKEKMAQAYGILIGHGSMISAAECAPFIAKANHAAKLCTTIAAITHRTACPLKGSNLINVFERDLLRIMQQTYGIKWFENRTEIFFDSNGKEKITAPTYLLMILSKYKKNEQPTE